MTEETKLILDKLSNIETKMSDMEIRMSDMETKMSDMDARMSNMEARMSDMETKMSDMDARMSNMETRMSDIQVTLENETNHNIRIIAEGHLDLSRKLDGAMKVENEKEIMLIRLNILENEVRRLKETVQTTA